MNIEIADRLVQLRRDNGLSQEELAAKLGVSRQAVFKWERCESSPDTDNLIALARLYGVSLDALLLDGGDSACQYQTAPQADGGAPEGDGMGGRSEPYYSEADEAADVMAAAQAWDAADQAYSKQRRKRLRKVLLAIPYPVVLVILFLAIGFSTGLWHPAWMLFLTTPIYYCIAGSL